MTKCTKCGTGWTSSGLPLCPICGTKVPGPITASRPVADPIPLIQMPAPSFAKAAEGKAEPAAVRKNGTAVLEPPPDPRKAKTEVRPKPPVLRWDPPENPDVRIKLLEPSALDAPVQKDPPAPAPPAVPKKETVVLSASEPAPLPPMKEMNPVEAESRFRLLDPSAADIPVQKELPSPARPLIAPLIFGSLAFVPAILVPLTMAFESTRVLGVLGFCMAGFFAPFAPIAWMVGLSAEQRRRDQALRPERAVTLGRKLGQVATLVLVGEMTVFLVAIAALRLSGSFPHTFWSVF
jgi:hypothetical protein